MAIINGTNGNDTLTATAGESNTLNLLAGNDIGTGAELSDTINGNQGNDILIGAGGGDSLEGDQGSDLLTGGGLTPLPDGIFDTLDVTGVTTLDAGEDEAIAGDDNGDGAVDQIVLGGKTPDGTPIIHYDQAGIGDYALVDDFVSGQDKLVVGGDLGSYSFGTSPIEPEDDRNALFYNGELIAIIDNEGTLANVNDLITSIDPAPFADIL